jgi:chemotaxis protein MotB
MQIHHVALSQMHRSMTDLTDDMEKTSQFGLQIDEDGWQLTYMDVITLLFSTFVLLLALYGNQVSKQREVLDGLNLQPDFQLRKNLRPSIAESEDEAPAEPDRISILDPDQPDQAKQSAATPREEATELARDIAEQHALDNISKRVAAQGLGDMVTVERQKEGVIITMKETLLFPSGQAALSARGVEWIRAIAPAIRSEAAQVSVEGHTDNIPISTGTFPSNWELSAGRASSVVRELVLAGIPPDKLRAVGYGDSRPVAYNAFPSGREQNRRVQIKLSFSGNEAK